LSRRILLLRAAAGRARGAARLQFKSQSLQHGGGVAGERHPGRIVLVEHLRVDVDMHQVLRHRGAEAAGGEFAEARADGEQGVAFGEGVARRRHGVRAEAEAGMQRMVVREHRLALQRGGDRCLQELGQIDELRQGVDRAPADKEAGALRRQQEVRRARDVGL
jgi:hypothetical protein